jgi:hypothetical protein
MLSLYCRACRLRFSRAAAAAPARCPRCEGRSLTPSTRAVEANSWLASTVLADARMRSADRRTASGGS